MGVGGLTTRRRLGIRLLASTVRFGVTLAGMRLFAVTLLVFAVVASSASAATLTKREARWEARHFVKERVNEREFSWVTYWHVEPAYKCARVTDRVVECDFDMVDESDVDGDGYEWGCADTVRVRESRRFDWASYSSSPDCGYYYSDE